MWNCCHYLYFEFLAGRSLDLLEERCQHYIPFMKELQRNEAAMVSAPLWRLVLDLIQSPEAAHLSAATRLERHGTVDAVMASITQTSPVAPDFARVTESMLMAYRREYVAGAERSIERGNSFLGNFPFQPIGMWDWFLRGVCLYAAAKSRPKRRRRYRSHGKKVLAILEKFVCQGDINVRHHAALLAAEDLTLQRKFREARQSYESAIVGASRGGFIHDAAMANERYALCLLHELKDTESARFHFGEADRLYREWGAHVIANGLHEVRASLPKKEPAANKESPGGLLVPTRFVEEP